MRRKVKVTATVPGLPRKRYELEVDGNKLHPSVVHQSVRHEVVKYEDADRGLVGDVILHEVEIK